MDGRGACRDLTDAGQVQSHTNHSNKGITHDSEGDWGERKCPPPEGDGEGAWPEAEGHPRIWPWTELALKVKSVKNGCRS